MDWKDENFRPKATSKLFDFARQNRQKQTQAEALLWQYLRNRQINNYKMRRQHPIGNFVVDFYCHELKLVIEVDGGYHLQKEQTDYDQGRSFELEELGIKVLRFKNDEVLNDINAVIMAISKHLTLNPSPPGEGL